MDEGFDWHGYALMIYLMKQEQEKTSILLKIACSDDQPTLIPVLHRLHSHVIADPRTRCHRCWYPQLTRISDNSRTLVVIRCREPLDRHGKWLPGSGYGMNSLSVSHTRPQFELEPKSLKGRFPILTPV